MLQLPIFTMAILTGAANSIMTPTTTATSPLLRGHHYYTPRYLGPHPNSGHHSTYQGCLGYSDSELSQSWSFSGQAPSCSWVHTGDSSSSSSSGGSSSGSSGGSGSGSGGGSSGGSYGDDDSGNGNGSSSSNGDGTGDDDSNSGDDDSANGGGYGGNGDDDSGGNGAGGDDDEVVVSNEDVYNGDSGYDPIDDFDIEVVSVIVNAN